MIPIVPPPPPPPASKLNTAVVSDDVLHKNELRSLLRSIYLLQDNLSTSFLQKTNELIEKFDKNKNGIDLKEFRELMKELNITFSYSDESIEALFTNANNGKFPSKTNPMLF